MNSSSSLLLKILEVMARFRSITESQAIRLFPEFGMAQISWVLNKAVTKKYIARKVVNIPVETDAKIRKDRTRTRSEVIYYMKTTGKKVLLRHNKTVRCLKTSRLSGVHLQRLFHDLLIVEVLIWWMEGHNVKQYWVEDELSSMGENKADLRVLTVADDGSENQTDCEIVVQNHPIDIINKSNGMMWFTPSLTQKDTIEDAKVHHGVVKINLGGVPTALITPSRPLTLAEMELIQVLRQSDGALTAGAVAACLGRDRAKTSAKLKKLVRVGHLFSSSVQLVPGQQKGRPYLVYAIAYCLIDTWADREFAVRLSKMIEFAARKGIKVSHVDRSNETALVSAGSTSKRVKILDVKAYA